MALEGRVALVTGGGRGIGKAISLALAEDGADIAVNYRADEDAARETVGEIEQVGRRAIAVQASVDSLDDDERMVREVVDAFGFVDILVNNAGIASRGRPVSDTDPAEVERVIRAHAIGPHHLCRLVLTTMRERPKPPWRRWRSRCRRKSNRTASGSTWSRQGSWRPRWVGGW